MPRQKLTADFILTAFELANDAPAKINFLTILGQAVARRPKLAEAGYPTALAAASDDNNDIRGCAFEALDAIFTKRPRLAEPATMKLLARACIYDADLEKKAHEAIIPLSKKNPEWPNVTLPIFIEGIGQADVDTRIRAYEHFSHIVVRNPELAERTLPVARTHLTDGDDDIRYKALMDVDCIMQKRPELVDELLLLQVATMAAKDADASLRKEAALTLSDFAKKHSRRADDLQPNKRLLQVTARLQVIAGR